MILELRSRYGSRNGSCLIAFVRENGYTQLVWGVLLVSILALPTTALDVTLDKWYLGVFSHVNAQHASTKGNKHAGFEENGLRLGETSIFSRGKLTPKISLRSEHTLQARMYREDQVRLERLIVRYETSQHHWVELGKIHTPVNYWNAWFHHGRLFFPTVDRPAFFSDNFFPIHDIGLRLGGLLTEGGLKYDVFMGSGHPIASSATGHHHAASGEEGDQIFPDGIQSLNIALIYPWKNWTFRTATYLNGIRDSTYILRLHTLSIFMESQHFKGLFEFATKFSELSKETLKIRKWAFYQYVGYKLNERVMPYVGIDYLGKNRAIKSDDSTVKTMLGITLARGSGATLKTQLEFHNDSANGHEDRHSALIVQLSIGI